MTTLKPFDYNSLSALSERNTYITDGHGDEQETEMDRELNRNKYIVDGHGLTKICGSHNCPADADLATQEMLKARALYKMYVEHTKGTNKKKHDVEMTQFWISWAPGENPTDEMVMEDIWNLIMQTDLKDFICFYGIHRNTDNVHVHLSIGAYSKDGKKKLCMNKAKKYHYRAVMDRISAERGFSIIEPNAKMKKYEPEYVAWFEANRDKLTIYVPPEDEKDQGQRTKGQGKKKSDAQRFKDAKEREREKKEIEQREKLQNQFQWRRPEHIYNPKPDSIPILVIKLGLTLAGIYTPEVPHYHNRPKRTNCEYVHAKTDWKAQRMMDSLVYARECGVTTATGFHERKQEIGQRMNTIKKAIYETQKSLDKLSAPYDAYIRYNDSVRNGQPDEKAYAEMARYGIEDLDDMWRIYEQVNLLQQRLVNLNEQLDDEKKEYRKTMKAIKSTASPLISEKTLAEKQMQVRERQNEHKPSVATENALETKKKDIDDLIANADKRARENANNRAITVKRRMDIERT